MRTAAMVTVLLAGFAAAPAVAGDGKPRPHPHFDDEGTLSWSEKLADARAAAKKSGRLIFIEYGRLA